MKKNIIGIHLGRTNSSIARLNSFGIPEIISTQYGERFMPSIIFFSDENNEVLLGQIAKSSAKDDPKRVVKDFLQEMCNPNFRFKVDNDSYSATVLSAFILKKLVQDVSSLKHIGEIKKIVISVPIYFNEYARNATIEAGKLVGLEVIGIINEPTAIALYFATINRLSGNFIVYHLDEKSIDITALNIRGKEIKVLSSIVNHNLGGVDFDNIILKLFKQKFKEETGNELYSDIEGKAEFLLLAEQKKEELYSREKVKAKLRGDNGRATVIITQKEFNEEMEEYLIQIELLIKQVIRESNLKISEFENTLLSGENTKIPIIRESIKRVMGKEPFSKFNIDEAIALGATIRAGLSKNLDTLSDIEMQDVANHSYGMIDIADNGRRFNQIIIKKNSPLPISKTIYMQTSRDNQKYFYLEITQGEDRDPKYVEIIDEIVLEIPEPKPKGENIEITYSYDKNQMVSFRVVHINSGTTSEKNMAMSSVKVKKSFSIEKDKEVKIKEIEKIFSIPSHLSLEEKQEKLVEEYALLHKRESHDNKTTANKLKEKIDLIIQLYKYYN